VRWTRILLANNERRYLGSIENVTASGAFGDVSEGSVDEGEFIKRLPGLGVIYVAGDACEISMRGCGGGFIPVTVDRASTPVPRSPRLAQVAAIASSRQSLAPTPIAA
jgi:hypothetical protein